MFHKENRLMNRIIVETKVIFKFRVFLKICPKNLINQIYRKDFSFLKKNLRLKILFLNKKLIEYKINNRIN